MEKINILGSNVSVCNYKSVVDEIMLFCGEGRSAAVTACATHLLMNSYFDDELRYKINSFEIVTPDGQPVRWALNLLGRAGLADRVCGPELTLRICERAAAEEVKVYFYGSRESVLQKLKENLEKRFDGLDIAGIRASWFRQATEEEDHQDIDEINSSGASICFVGLGCPKQEKWAYDHRDRIKPVLVCVGAAFDFHAGGVARAPVWMQRYGLEWLFRLSEEPGRMWRRYIFNNPLYLILLFLQWAGLKKFQD